MVFHGTKIIEMDSRRPRPGVSRYDEIIGWDRNFISETSITRVYHLNPDPAKWPGGIFLKKIVADHWWRYFLRPAKSVIEAKNYRMMEAIQVPVPKVLAIGERRYFGGLVNAFIMTEGVAESETLEAYAENHSKQRDRAFFEIFDQLADIVQRMHAANFYHIDLQWRNVLVQKKSEKNEDGIRVFLIDCPRGGRRRLPYRMWNGKMHDLAGLEKLGRVYLSAKERLRWFKRYNGGRKFKRQDRAMIRAIERELK
jgi:hypothetical protein